jgi:hypothetical protein
VTLQVKPHLPHTPEETLPQHLRYRGIRCMVVVEFLAHGSYWSPAPGARYADAAMPRAWAQVKQEAIWFEDPMGLAEGMHHALRFNSSK